MQICETRRLPFMKVGCGVDEERWHSSWECRLPRLSRLMFAGPSIKPKLTDRISRLSVPNTSVQLQAFSLNHCFSFTITTFLVKKVESARIHLVFCDCSSWIALRTQLAVANSHAFAFSVEAAAGRKLSTLKPLRSWELNWYTETSLVLF